MGVTIHYRGTIDDLGQVETMEDRLLELIFSLGGRATIWRSFADDDSSRIMRGLIVELEPGQDTFSLIVSPEGHLTPLFEIEEAEKAPFEEPPLCFVKTQFGSLQGHIAIVHLLDAIGQQYCSNLEVTDESEYYENRDVAQLHQKLQFLRSAISSMTDSLKEHGLSGEAAEDPSLLATRIERIAALVREKMLAKGHEPSRSAEDSEAEEFLEPSLEEEVETMDRLRRRNDLRNERMTRRIAEATASGMSAEAAFELAMQEEGLSSPSSEQDEHDLPDEASELGEPNSPEPWLESLPPHPFDQDNSPTCRENHPAVEQAQSFLSLVMDLAENENNKSSYFSVLTRGSMDIVGGLAQATSGELDGNLERALAITQLKRALSGHAFARGAIFGLRGENAITQQQSTQLHDEIEALLTVIHELAENAWS